jgi:prepilin-type N-terminal cleavage/methylation domain-containing protein
MQRIESLRNAPFGDGTWLSAPFGDQTYLLSSPYGGLVGRRVADIGGTPVAPARDRAFVLLEVLVSLAIIGVTFAMVLNAFTVSMKAATICTQRTEASVLARNLIEEWECKPPQAGEIRGLFEKYPQYSYRADYQPEQVDYPGIPALEEGRLVLFRPVDLDIYYQSPRQGAAPKRILHIETALSSSERFGAQARQENHVPLAE